MLRECSLTLCCVAAIMFGAGCSETTDIETAAPPQDTAPRPPNPTPTPWITAVEPHQGFNDEPALAATPSGDVFVGWISYRNGADALVVARYSHEGDRFLKQDEWVALGGAGTYLLDLDAAADEAGAHFVFAREIDGNWDIHAIRVGANGPTQPIRIATGPESQIKPAAAWHDGTLFVAWESNADSKRRIYSASLRDGLVAEHVRVSADSPSNYGPSVAADRHGRVSVSWHS
ncbi:MAG: hypothetical protein F4X77_08915, partial [Acidobacteriia bacterium]|nr:hypothetical protein [Terriglobia bacterium]